MPIHIQPTHSPARGFVPAGRGFASGWFAFMVGVSVLAIIPASGQEKPVVALTELPLFSPPQETFSVATAARDYFIRLPEHVAFRDGSELHLVLHSPDGITPPLCSLSIALNGSIVGQTNLHGSAEAPIEEGVIPLRIGIPAGGLARGWNKLSLQFTLHPVKGDELEGFGRSQWTLRRAECFLSLAFERMPRFSELSRFPHTIAEGKLLRPDVDSPFSDSIVPALSILVPGRPRDVHLRATAIIAARLGQLGYLVEHHCRIQAIEFWKAETDLRDAILIGRREQLGGIDLPAGVRTALDSLASGEGLLADFLHNPDGEPRRVILISGADDIGLEKAALTIGSSPALSEVAPSPAIITQVPEVPVHIEATAQPGPKILQVSDSGPIQFRGAYRSEESVFTWRLPPGFRVVSGGSLRLQFDHSPNLLGELSSLEALVNGTSVGVIPLSPDNATNGSAVLPLPSTLRGRDPMMLTFRAMIAPPEADCDQSTNVPAWIDIAANSTIESVAEPVRVEELGQLQRFLLADSFGRRAAYAVPAGPSLEHVRMLFGIWFELGRNLPSSPLLWPEVITYQPGAPLSSTRLKGRSVLVLGSVADWAALPPESMSPAIIMDSPDADAVLMQGVRHEVSEFEPSLAFTQMFPSPWSEGNVLVLAGGWKDYAIPAMKRLLLDPSTPGQLHGQLGAIDVLGRAAAYDLWTMSRDSFAERIQAQIPSGLTAEASQRRVVARDARVTAGKRWNLVTFYAFGSLLVALVFARLWLMREHSRFRRKVLAAEKAVGGAP